MSTPQTTDKNARLDSTASRSSNVRSYSNDVRAGIQERISELIGLSGKEPKGDRPSREGVVGAIEDDLDQIRDNLETVADLISRL